VIHSRAFVKSITIAALLLAFAGGHAAYSAEATSTKRAAHATTNKHVQIGYASWYGAQHSGHRTASGEPYDPQSLTAAHPTLPLHTMVRVTNMTNGLSVDVRVNDRGPFRGHRVIDLSQNAAATIGLKRRGVAKVKVEPLPEAQPVVYRVPRD
jgi:rare lipoprotein A